MAVKVFGDDLEVLKSRAAEVERVLKSIDGAADVSAEQVTGQPVLQIKVKQEELARYGLTAKVVLDLVESVGSKPLGEVIEGQLRFPLVVRLPERWRGDPEAIKAMLIAAPTGETIPLSRVAKVQKLEGPSTITREWGQRRVVVTANVRGRDLGSFVAEARRKVAAQVVMPPGRYRIEWGGQFENFERARLRLMIVVPLAGLLVFGLLYLTYRNVVDALRVFTGVPFGWVGGIFALWLRDMPFSISAAIGFIALSGVAVLDDMILVSYVRQLRRKGLSVDESVRQAAVTRLRPVLMTTLVASLGFLPMAFSTGMGAEVQRPLATVVIGGVLGAMVMSLLVLRVLYLAFDAAASATVSVLTRGPSATVPSSWNGWSARSEEGQRRGPGLRRAGGRGRPGGVTGIRSGGFVMQSILRSLGVPALVAALVFFTGGCGGSPTTKSGQAENEKDKKDKKNKDKKVAKPGASDTSEDGWWCNDHGIPEKECSMCKRRSRKKCKKRPATGARSTNGRSRSASSATRPLKRSMRPSTANTTRVRSRHPCRTEKTTPGRHLHPASDQPGTGHGGKLGLSRAVADRQVDQTHLGQPCSGQRYALLTAVRQGYFGRPWRRSAGGSTVLEELLRLATAFGQYAAARTRADRYRTAVVPAAPAVPTRCPWTPLRAVSSSTCAFSRLSGPWCARGATLGRERALCPNVAASAASVMTPVLRCALIPGGEYSMRVIRR